MLNFHKSTRWVLPILLVSGFLGYKMHVSHAERVDRKVVMISIDSLRPEFYLSKDFDSPTLKQLVATGAYAEGVTSVFPSVTYPNHTALVTGVYTGKHGVLSNSLYDATQGPLPAWYWEASK